MFKRLAIVGETKIRLNGNKICRSIQGMDSNALYLSCVGAEAMTGSYTRRRKSNNYVRERQYYDCSATEWLEYIIHSENLAIKHGLNNGEVTITDKYRVDGYCKPDLVF